MQLGKKDLMTEVGSAGDLKQKIVIKWDKDFSLQSQAVESFKNNSLFKEK